LIQSSQYELKNLWNFYSKENLFPLHLSF
jgi:hypothetical protein